MKSKNIDNQRNGKLLGTTGFIVSLIPGAWLAGLVFSIVGYQLSKKAGQTNKLALAGIWISSIFIALILAGVLVIAGLAYVDTRNQNRDQDTLVTVSLVRSTANAYWVNNDTYPNLSELKAEQPFDNLSEKYEEPALVGSSTPEAGQIGYTECNDDNQITGARIHYYSYRDKEVKLADTLGDC